MQKFNLLWLKSLIRICIRLKGFGFLGPVPYADQHRDKKLDPVPYFDPLWDKKLDPDPHWNQCWIADPQQWNKVWHIFYFISLPNGVREWSCGIDDTLGPHSEFFAADFVPAHGAARFPIVILKINQLYRCKSINYPRRRTFSLCHPKNQSVITLKINQLFTAPHVSLCNPKKSISYIVENQSIIHGAARFPFVILKINQ